MYKLMTTIFGFQKLIFPLFKNTFSDWPEYDDNYNTLWLTLASKLQTNHIEYYVYDLTAVVSSIGGGIGIFLGYSCFGVASSMLKKWYQSYIDANLQPRDIHPTEELADH